MLPQSCRLRSNREFRRVYARGRCYVNDCAALHVLNLPGRPGIRQVGFVASKKHGGAVVRNRLRRTLSEAVRLQWSALRPEGFDAVVIARSGLRRATWKQICCAVEDLFDRAALLVKSETSY